MSSATAPCGRRWWASRRCSATGSVVSHLAGLAKDNTGYDLAGLLTGSEGTLGVVTAARLRLVPRLEHRVTAGSAWPAWPRRWTRWRALRPGWPGWRPSSSCSPTACGSSPSSSACDHRPRSGRRRRSSWRSAATTIPWRSWPRRVAELDLVEEPVVAVDPGAAATALGAAGELRRGHQPARAAGQARRLAARWRAWRRSSAALPDRRARRAGGRRVRPPRRRQPPRQRHRGAAGRRRAGDDRRAGGAGARWWPKAAASRPSTASGTAKAAYLHLCRSPAEIAAFRAVKSALDPHGILNPHALLAAQPSG